MNDVPTPENVVPMFEPTKHVQEQITVPEFPHTRPRGNGAPMVLNTSDNLAELLKHLGLQGVLNEMTFELEVLQNGKPCRSIDSVRSQVISAMSIYDMPRAALDDHLTALSETTLYHPVRDLLDSAEWDGQPRVKSVIECLGAKDPNLAESVLTRWLVGCVASLYEPTFKSKLVPILQGDQSYMKTAFVERIAKITARSFLEGAELNPANKDSVLHAIRSWIVELGELERTTKGRHVNQGSIKAFITKEVDTVRPPFAKGDVRKPRKTNFIATVNGTDFLKDDTGNSRYAVIELVAPTSMVKLNELLGWHYDGSGSLEQPNPELLLQFWLEVKALYQSGYGWMLTLEEQRLTQTITERYNDKGEWYEVLHHKFIDVPETKVRKAEWLTSTSVCEYMGCDVRNNRYIGRALTQLAKDGLVEERVSRGKKQYLLVVVTERGD